MLLQPEGGYRAGLDAVVLAAAIGVDPAQDARIVDLGAGVGAVGLCLAARAPAVRVVLVERAAELAALAQRNIAANGLAARARVITADLTQPAAVLEAAGLEGDSFDHVVANPPYQTEGEGRMPTDALKAGAHVMAAGGIDRWVRTAARLAKAGGTATVIHRADALGELLAAFAGRFGAVTVRPVHPRLGEPAMRILVAGIKGSRAPLQLLPGLVVHEATGHGFTPQMQGILRDGRPLI